VAQAFDLAGITNTVGMVRAKSLKVGYPPQVHKAIGGSYLFPSRFSCCAVSKYLTCSESFILALPDVKFAHNVFAS
jgi:hypothetical protein